MYGFHLNLPEFFFKNSSVLEVEISDHHGLIITNLTISSEFIKGNPKMRHYRDYKRKKKILRYDNE